MLTINQNLQQGRYRIVSQLEQNSTGSAYEAFDKVLGANVLLKESPDSPGKVITPAQFEARKTNFGKRAKALTALNHESLLAVKDFFSEIDHHYLVAEIAGSGTLGELLEKNKKPFSLAEVSDWADKLLDALNYLHTLTPHVIHGEVKPQNIRLMSGGKVKLIVFNLVKSDDETDAATANQTFDAAVLPYLPLEQIWEGLDAASKKVILTNYDEQSEKILEQPPDARSDIFSLAATLYHLLTARTPADALTRSIDILEGKPDPLQSPSEFNPSVPREVSDVLMKALEIKREDRFSSAVIMRQVLRTAFVRVKEREANAAVNPLKIEDDAVLEIPLVQPKPVSVPKSTELESEQARQLELIKQQLREVEKRRLEAEKRAAEAEKRLQEAEKTAAAETQPEFAPSAQADVSPAMKNGAEFNEEFSDDLPNLFNEPPEESGIIKKVAAAAVVLLILGGGFGIWTFTQSKQNNTAPTISTTTIPPPTGDTKTAPGSNEQTTAGTENQPVDSPGTEVTTQNPSAVKPKPVVATPTPQSAQTKKPGSTPAKQAETPKKVTLDDLLKDN